MSQENDGSSGKEPGAMTRSEQIKMIGGLVAVGVGVLAVTIITAAALVKHPRPAAPSGRWARGGAYFGMKLGSDQSKTASDGQKAEAAKAQVFAAHIPSADAPRILDLAEQAASKAVER